MRLLRQLLFVLLLFLSLLSTAFADRVLKEKDYQSLLNKIDSLEKLNQNDKIQISGLEEELTISEKITTKQDDLLTMQEESLKEQNTLNLWEKIEKFLWGIVTGGLLTMIITYSNV